MGRSWLVPALLVVLTGCGLIEPIPPGAEPRMEHGSGKQSATAARSRTPSPVAFTTPSPLVSRSHRPPRKEPDDINGDGYADLLLPWFTETGLQAIVYGSAQGLLQAALRTRAKEPVWVTDGLRADFDGDGFGDLAGTAREAGGRARPGIFWGSAQGLGETLTPLRGPLVDGLTPYGVTSGDFNGDGKGDLALRISRGEDAGLVLLYGPFRRSGTWAWNSTPQTLPFNYVGSMAGGFRGLLVYEGDDGEQAAAWLFKGDGNGLARRGGALNTGLASAFGDFDGDGRQDVAVADSGARNDEQGSETEPRGVDKTLTVYYGKGAKQVFTGAKGRLVAGDFNGDGLDDLAHGRYFPRQPESDTHLMWGSAKGLRDGGGRPSWQDDPGRRR